MSLAQFSTNVLKPETVGAVSANGHTAIPVFRWEGLDPFWLKSVPAGRETQRRNSRPCCGVLQVGTSEVSGS